MKPNRPIQILFALGLGVALLAPAQASEGDLKRLRKEVCDTRQELLRLQAEHAALSFERHSLPGKSPKKLEIPEEHPGLRETLQRILRNSKLLRDSRESRTQQLESLRKSLTKESCVADWEVGLDRALPFLGEVADAEAQNGLPLARFEAGTGTAAENPLDLLPPQPGPRIVWKEPSWLPWEEVGLQTALWAWVLATTSFWLTVHAARQSVPGLWRALSPPGRVALGGAGIVWLLLFNGLVVALVVTGQPLVRVGGETARDRTDVQEFARWLESVLPTSLQSAGASGNTQTGTSSGLRLPVGAAATA